MTRSLLPLALAFALTGCSSSVGPIDAASSERPREVSLAFGDARPLETRPREAAPPDRARPDLGPWPTTGVVRKPIDLAGCSGKGPGTQDCHARVAIDASRCSPSQRCDRLLVFWAGGDQSCAAGVYNGVLDLYAGKGFVAACAQPYDSSDEAGRYPYYQEFDRMQALMVAIRALPEVAAVWDGRRLLISGVSHGGTAPLAVIAARAALRTHAADWTGSVSTAVVLNDGISSPAALDEWASKQTGCELWHSRIVGRYGDGSPLFHSCTGAACHCAGPPHAAEWAKDTVALGSSAPKSPYTCDDVTPAAGKVLYRFVSCGGGLGQPCNMLTGDVIPEAQQQAAHDGILSCAGVEASYQSYPLCAHPLCGTTKLCGVDDTLAWLASKGW